MESDKDAKPTHRPLYQLSPIELKAMKPYVQELCDSGKIRPINSPYGAPLFLVKEKDRSLRSLVCLSRSESNYQEIQCSFASFGWDVQLFGAAKIFSKMHFKTEFLQIRVKPEDIERPLLIRITVSLSIWLCIWDYGMHLQPSNRSWAVSLMIVLMSSWYLNVWYIDIQRIWRITSKTSEHCFVSSQRSPVARIAIELRVYDTMNFISPHDCWKRRDQKWSEKVEILQNWPDPMILMYVKRLWVSFNSIRRSIKDFSILAALLTNLTKKGVGIQKWNVKCDEAFESLKKAITSSPILGKPDWEKTFRDHIDTSSTSIIGTLTKLDDSGKDRVIAFFSKKVESGRTKL